MVLIMLINSCIKEPPPQHIQANILGITVDDPAYVQTNDVGSTYSLVFSEQVDATAVAPIFSLSPGATISPASGEPQDFSSPVTYTVRSESGNEREFTVQLIGNITLIFDFEDWVVTNPFAAEGRPDIEVPQMADPLWASTNYGVATGLGQINFGQYPSLDEYSTKPTQDSHSGTYAAQLTTIHGGSIIGVTRIPFIPGNLFRGNYAFSLSDPSGSLQFGIPHPSNLGIPIKFKGFYKYQPGEVFYGEGEVIDDNRIDEFNLYAVFFKVAKGELGAAEFLNGHSIRNEQHADYSKVVATAILPDNTAKDSYTAFDLDFEYLQEVDFEANDYKLTIVALSSKEGASYQVAPGSTLIIDDLEIVTDLFGN